MGKPVPRFPKLPATKRQAAHAGQRLQPGKTSWNFTPNSQKPARAASRKAKRRQCWHCFELTRGSVSLARR